VIEMDRYILAKMNFVMNLLHVVFGSHCIATRKTSRTTNLKKRIRIPIDGSEEQGRAGGRAMGDGMDGRNRRLFDHIARFFHALVGGNSAFATVRGPRGRILGRVIP